MGNELALTFNWLLAHGNVGPALAHYSVWDLPKVEFTCINWSRMRFEACGQISSNDATINQLGLLQLMVLVRRL